MTISLLSPCKITSSSSTKDGQLSLREGAVACPLSFLNLSSKPWTFLMSATQSKVLRKPSLHSGSCAGEPWWRGCGLERRSQVRAAVLRLKHCGPCSHYLYRRLLTLTDEIGRNGSSVVAIRHASFYPPTAIHTPGFAVVNANCFKENVQLAGSRPLRVTPFGTDKPDGKFGQQNVLNPSFSGNSSHGVDAPPSPTSCSCESSHPVRKDHRS